MQKFMMLMAVLFLTASVKSQTKKPVPKPVAKPSATATPKPLLKSGLDSLSYAIGVTIGTNMKMQGIENLSYATLNKGIADALKGNKPLMDENQCNMTIQQKLQEYMSKKSGVVKDEGRKFLENNKKQPGVVVLPSGIQYKIISQGNGVKPTLADTIKVHYKGTTIDGNIFDDSYSRGEPIEFPLGNLIEGWKQTLVLMPVGSKWQLFIPSDFAYGDRPQPNIPGGSTLIFELELLDVKPVKK
ncbi:MAG: FKBP-type peptidyl-prolyl cis-trans isomerase [Chitinophagaceae bacterium]|nr:FKBP-type peptidyl-prolyl cis-trans isomerase [Chitinophagaceae bacterium]